MEKEVKKFTMPRAFRFLAYGTPPNEKTGFDQYSENPDFNTVEQWKMLAECGFGYAQPIGYDRTDEHIEKSMACGEAVGVKVFTTDTDTSPYALPKLIKMGGTYEEMQARIQENEQEIIAHYNKFTKYASFAGVFASDEPNATLFPAIRAAQDWFNEKFPEYEFFVNLFPKYANDEQLFASQAGTEGNKTYAEYVQNYCKIVQPCSVSYDHYALLDELNKEPYPYRPTQIKDDFFYNLVLVAENAKQLTVTLGKDVPPLIYLQTMQFECKRNLENYEMWSWQCYTSLAFGMQGIQTFCYFSMFKDEDWEGFPISDAMIDRYGKKTKNYDYVKRTFADIKALEKTYLSYDWEGTKGIPVQEKSSLLKNFEALELSTLKDITDVKTTQELVIGQFKSRENASQKAYMVTNCANPFPENGTPSANVTLRFDGVDKVVVHKPGAIKETVNLVDGVLSLTIPCGDGFFLEPIYNA